MTKGKRLGATIVRYAMLVSEMALLVPCALYAKTTSVDVPAEGGAWSTFTTWSDGMPADGDTVILNNNNSSPVTIENDTADSLAAIFVGGQSGITITGRDLELTGNSECKITGVATWYYAISNEVPLIVDVPVEVSAYSLWHFRNDLTLNRDVFVADDEQLCLYRTTADDTSQASKYNLTFNGHLHATNATLVSGVNKENNVIFNKSIHVDTIDGYKRNQYTYFSFYASGNTWENLDEAEGLKYARWNLYALNAHDPTQPMKFGSPVNNNNDGQCFLYADQDVRGISCAAATFDWNKIDKYSGRVHSDNYSTLYIRPDANCTAYCQFGSQDGNYRMLNVNFAAVGDNAESVVQTLVDRCHTMNGSLVVSSGTLRTEGRTRFLNLPTLTLSGGVFESACTNAASDVEFPVLERLTIASSAVFRIDDASTSSPFAAGKTILNVEYGGKIEVPSGMTVDFSSVFYNNSFVPAGTYTANTCDWIAGDGSVKVSVPDNWNIWSAEVDGSWSVDSNWSKGTVPTADQVAVLLASKNDFTVTADDISTVPSQIMIWGLNGKKATLETGSSISLTDCNLLVSDGGVLSIPEGASVTKNNNAGFTVENGGKVSVAGSFSGKDLTASVGGKLYVSGSFAVTNETEKLFDFLDGADIEIDGGLFRGAGEDYPVFEFNVNYRDITFVATNNATVDLWWASSDTLKFYGKDFTLAGNSTFEGGMTFGLGINDGEGLTNTVNVIDGAKLKINTNLTLGQHDYGGSRTVVMNIATDKKTEIPNNVAVGYGGRGVLNVDGSNQMTFAGDYGLSVPRGVEPDHRTRGCGGGEVNVLNGTISCTTCRQSSYKLSGFNIACWSWVSVDHQDAELPGVMNIFKDGEVRVDVANNGNAHSHFIVGSGLLADGKVNVYGGKIVNNSDFNPLVGQWAGKGAINVYEGGYVYMKETMYVGGSFTNDLVSFKRESDSNGGADFDQYFPIKNTTGEGVINVEDGTFVAASNAVFSIAGTGSLSIGTNGLFIAKNICLSNSVNSADSSANVSTLSVKFGETTAGHVVCGTIDEAGNTTIDGTLTVSAGAKLVVDASELTEPESRYIPLVQFATMEGSFAESNIKLIKPSDNSASNWSVVRTKRNGVDGYYLNASKSGFVLIVR